MKTQLFQHLKLLRHCLSTLWTWAHHLFLLWLCTESLLSFQIQWVCDWGAWVSPPNKTMMTPLDMWCVLFMSAWKILFCVVSDGILHLFTLGCDLQVWATCMHLLCGSRLPMYIAALPRRCMWWGVGDDSNAVYVQGVTGIILINTAAGVAEGCTGMKTSSVSAKMGDGEINGCVDGQSLALFQMSLIAQSPLSSQQSRLIRCLCSTSKDPVTLQSPPHVLIICFW